jgi:hypothetical protein
LVTAKADFIRNACFTGDGGGEKAEKGRLLNAEYIRKATRQDERQSSASFVPPGVPVVLLRIRRGRSLTRTRIEREVKSLFSFPDSQARQKTI